MGHLKNMHLEANLFSNIEPAHVVSVYASALLWLCSYTTKPLVGGGVHVPLPPLFWKFLCLWRIKTETLMYTDASCGDHLISTDYFRILIGRRSSRWWIVRNTLCCDHESDYVKRSVVLIDYQSLFKCLIFLHPLMEAGCWMVKNLTFVFVKMKKPVP